MQNRFPELDIFSFSLSEDFIPITDSGTSDHFRQNSNLAEKINFLCSISLNLDYEILFTDKR